MDDGGPSAYYFIGLLVLLVLDVIVYGFGAALHNLKAEDLFSKSEEEGEEPSEDQNEKIRSKSGIFLSELMNNPTDYVNTVQLFVFILNIIIGRFYVERFGIIVGGFIFSLNELVASVLGQIVVAFLLLYVFLSIGVLLPKKLARRHPKVWAMILSPFIKILMAVLRPFTSLIEVTVHGIMYLCGIRDFDDDTDVTEEEIRSMVSEGQEQGVLQDSEADMITNIFEFSDKEVRDIMTHRNDICGIEGTMSLEDAISFMLQGNNSRFPVFLDNIDHIIGIVHIRDAVQKDSESGNEKKEIRQIKGLMRQPMYVPETRNIESLFHSMQSTKTQIAIVIDEYGQTAGLVSMEDILEEIVGNIMDEYDEDESFITPSGKPGEFVALGRTPIETVEKRFGIDLHEDEFETLNGLLISKMDRIPEEDEKYDVTIDGYNFSILEVQNHMITSVGVKKIIV
ncbi:putative hemolysin [Butyrivibrio fibrisolvens]|uniref:Putative hemolysin n=1 Tax=Butyrivibrio fibrisolvens TaxID=831 RepID=A0A1H9WTI7_BUTFI|nr:hemolysin family protein [Butyrivibrio fibrisolvens]MCR4636942.1 hemolysin family protein [Butyrivibrio sp.]SES37111.1 putative hemolysin [Butyrivibrio fibrisolvens]